MESFHRIGVTDMSAKRKTPIQAVAATPNLLKFDPAARFCLEHPVPILLDSPEAVPEEYRSTAPPAVGAGALCDAHKAALSKADLQLLRRYIPGMVQLCFRVRQHKGPWRPTTQIGCERMWVGLRACKGNWPKATYQGQLLNLPVFIDREVLQIGSAVTFQMAHVHRNFTSTVVKLLHDDKPYVEIEKDSKPWLTVSASGWKAAYPLTANGIRKAGRDLYDNQHFGWSYAGSVDCPKEYGRRLDVKGLLEGAFVIRAAEAEDTRFSGNPPDIHGVFPRLLDEANLGKSA
jgi:hypothetical protein